MNSVFTFVKNHAARMKRMPPAVFNVLVVDDEEPVRKFVERVLREAGYKTATAADGPEAIEVAKKMESLDILVTDVMMPQMTGDELARRLRQTEQRGLKVLYLTGFSDRLFKEKVTLWEDEAFLDKPCGVQGLLQAVSLLLFGRFDAPNDFTS
jgi:two-component system, cell cycle sensor histidine kinase and response regulator CckA